MAGVDLGGSESMSAIAVIGIESGVLMCWAGWGDNYNLLERGRRDQVDTLYLDMRERGELTIYPNRVVPGGQFVWDVLQKLEERGCSVKAIGADRKWRQELVGVLKDSGYRGPVELRGTGGGQSWMDGATDVRAFQRLVLEREIAAAPSLLLRNAIVSSTLDVNQRGNYSLDKGNNRNSRIDALQAAVNRGWFIRQERGAWRGKCGSRDKGSAEVEALSGAGAVRPAGRAVQLRKLRRVCEGSRSYRAVASGRGADGSRESAVIVPQLPH